MRIATWEDIRTIEVGDTPEPEMGPRDLLLDVALCGICGSDVHSYLEGAWIAKGIALGHEFAGIVTAVGEDVRDIAVGDRIAMNGALYCGECDQCRAGHGNLCRNMSGGSAGFADVAVVREARLDVNVFQLPDDLPFEAAAFLEPMSVAARAVRQLQPPLDEPVLVTGLGTIGQCVVQVLRAMGATTIVALDTSSLRRDAARKSGASAVLDPRDGDVVSTLLEAYGTTASPYRPEQGAFGSAFECAGAPPVFDQLFRLVRAGGSVSLVALTAKPITLDPNAVVQKELRVLGSFAYTTEDVRAAWQLIAARAVRPEHLITHTFALDDIADAFEAQSDSTASVKVMVHP
jgi:2-desacetyl-2-hydroxyethyl bacteriochlorophyllide A dehydrogenase